MLLPPHYIFCLVCQVFIPTSSFVSYLDVFPLNRRWQSNVEKADLIVAMSNSHMQSMEQSQLLLKCLICLKDICIVFLLKFLVNKMCMCISQYDEWFLLEMPLITCWLNTGFGKNETHLDFFFFKELAQTLFCIPFL